MTSWLIVSNAKDMAGDIYLEGKKYFSSKECCERLQEVLDDAIQSPQLLK